MLDNGITLSGGEYRIVSGTPRNGSRAADVILVVDESGSMTTEHEWIPNMIQQLDAALISVNIGRDPENRFGLVGFGDDCIENFAAGRVVMNSAQEVFGASGGFDEFTMMLNASGQVEDGYSGISVALNGYPFRDVAKQFIIVTDEDRDVLNPSLTRESIRQALEDAGVVLNAAVSEEYSGGILRALGIDSTGAAYVFDPSAGDLFRIVDDVGKAVNESGHGSTNVDYTQLALELGGASWDLSLLRRGVCALEAIARW